MLPGLIPFPPTGVGSVNGFYSAIQSAGQTSNLELALDAADSSSYSGSGGSWLDLSGHGYDFLLGNISGADSADPDFVGSAGSLDSNTYWEFDGTENFTYDTSNETWMENIHKNNAAFSFLSIFYPSSTGIHPLAVTAFSNAQTGFAFYVSSNVPTFTIGKGGSPFAISKSGSGDFVEDQWNVAGLSVDEAANGFFYRNGAYVQVSAADTWSATYSSPSASAATNTMRIASGIGSNFFQNTSRYACLAGWSRALSKANFDSIYDLIKGRFGLV